MFFFLDILDIKVRHITEQDGKGWLFFIIANPGRERLTDILLAAQAVDNRHLFNNSVGELAQPTKVNRGSFGFFFFPKKNMMTRQLHLPKSTYRIVTTHLALVSTGGGLHCTLCTSTYLRPGLAQAHPGLCTSICHQAETKIKEGTSKQHPQKAGRMASWSIKLVKDR